MFYLITGRKHSGRDTIIDILRNLYGWNIIEKDAPLTPNDFTDGVSAAIATPHDVKNLQSKTSGKNFHIIHIAPNSNDVERYADEMSKGNVEKYSQIMNEWVEDEGLFETYETELKLPITFNKNGDVAIFSNETIRHNFTEKQFIDAAAVIDRQNRVIENTTQIIRTCMSANIIESENNRTIIKLEDDKTYAISPEIAAMLLIAKPRSETFDILLSWLSIPGLTIASDCAIINFGAGPEIVQRLLKEPMFKSAQEQMNKKLNADDVYNAITTSHEFAFDIDALMRKHISRYILNMRETNNE